MSSVSTCFYQAACAKCQEAQRLRSSQNIVQVASPLHDQSHSCKRKRTPAGSWESQDCFWVTGWLFPLRRIPLEKLRGPIPKDLWVKWKQLHAYVITYIKAFPASGSQRAQPDSGKTVWFHSYHMDWRTMENFLLSFWWFFVLTKHTFRHNFWHTRQAFLKDIPLEIPWLFSLTRFTDLCQLQVDSLRTTWAYHRPRRFTSIGQYSSDGLDQKINQLTACNERKFPMGMKRCPLKHQFLCYALEIDLLIHTLRPELKKAKPWILAVWTGPRWIALSGDTQLESRHQEVASWYQSKRCMRCGCRVGCYQGPHRPQGSVIITTFSCF